MHNSFSCSFWLLLCFDNRIDDIHVHNNKKLNNIMYKSTAAARWCIDHITTPWYSDKPLLNKSRSFRELWRILLKCYQVKKIALIIFVKFKWNFCSYWGLCKERPCRILEKGSNVLSKHQCQERCELLVEVHLNSAKWGQML